jgi:hypothetical protein
MVVLSGRVTAACLATDGRFSRPWRLYRGREWLSGLIRGGVRDEAVRCSVGRDLRDMTLDASSMGGAAFGPRDAVHEQQCLFLGWSVSKTCRTPVGFLAMKAKGVTISFARTFSERSTVNHSISANFVSLQ